MRILDLIYKMFTKQKVKKIPTNLYVGYCPVNYWYTIDSNKLAKALWKNGCNIAFIELMGCNEEHNENKIPMIKSKAKEFISNMKYFNITTFVNIVNWNSDGLTKQSDAWFNDLVNFFVNDIGKDKVILQACSEWSGSKAQKWCDEMAVRWSGLKAWNKSSRPSSMPAGYNMLDWHIASVSKPMGPQSFATLVNTDHSVTLSEIQVGGRDGQKAKPLELASLLEKTITSGRSFNYYGFLHRSIDIAAIDTIGNILKKYY